MQKGIPENPREPLDLHYWANHCLDMIRNNFDRRGVFPVGKPGPYNAFQYINAERGRKKKWHSTGMGLQQMYARVYTAAHGETERIDFFFRHYLNLMDMGVGARRPIENVSERRTNAKWAVVTQPFKWGRPVDILTAKERKNRPKGIHARRSRPAMMMEFRHQATRLQTLLSVYYGRFAEVNMLPDYGLSNGEFIFIDK